MRCFIGVPVGGELAEECIQLAAGHAGAAPLGNLHMTLAFMGECRAEQVEAMVPHLKTLAASFAAFSLPFTRCEPFPQERGPFLALTGALAPELEALHKGLEERLSDCGIHLEPRPFRPHVTLARPGHSLPVLTGEWRLLVSSFWLYQSQRGENDSPIYSPLARFPFSCP